MRRAVTLVVASLLAAGAGAQVDRIGSEFQVNTYTANFQGRPSVASGASGDFVVTWESSRDRSSTGVFAQRFSSAGGALGIEFQVNTYTTDYQYDSVVAVSASGAFVVVWGSLDQDGEDGGIFLRRFSSDGFALDDELQVNTYTSGEQRFPAVTAENDGDFIVAWTSGHDGSGTGIFAQRFSSAGLPDGGEFQVNDFTPSYQTTPQLSALPSGDFVVVWDSNQDGSLKGVFARRFSSAGVAFAVEFQVNTITDQSQRYPSVAASDDGAFTVVWESGYGQDGDMFGIVARRFSSAGVDLTGELQVNSYVTGNQRYPSVATNAAGDFVVAWQSDNGDGAGYGVFARRFSAAGAALTGEFQANTYTSGGQTKPAVAPSASGFVVAWESFNQDGSDQAVFAQRFAVPFLLDVDGNGSTAAFTDGILLLRYLFGFRGAILIDGAVDDDECSRCDATSIETYLAAHTG